LFNGFLHLFVTRALEASVYAGSRAQFFSTRCRAHAGKRAVFRTNWGDFWVSNVRRWRFPMGPLGDSSERGANTVHAVRLFTLHSGCRRSLRMAAEFARRRNRRRV
jgi:hypothetical protein